ncbi:MAG: hypothetical protein DDT37_00105 [Firmicutes bacterium]|nr:hypothetical protein [candidate division NPL-UPA2 bacterium]
MNYLTATEFSVIMVLLLAIFAIGLSTHAIREFRAVRRMYRTFMTGTTGGNLETLLMTLGERTARLEGDGLSQARLLREIEQRLPLAVQQVGLVRFNAYSDTGGELSFALALLDASGSGVVISSLYGRADARVYAKPFNEGQSTFPLSSEEISAVAQARSKAKSKKM